MDKIRVGIIGTGFAGKFHVGCLKKVYGVDIEISAVTSLRAESRQKFGKEHGIPVFPDVKSMLPHVDIIDVCSPPYVHEESILLAASAGKGIICEKPLTGYYGPVGDESFRGNKAPKQPMMDAVVERVKKMAEIIRSKNIFFGYAENFVYAPAVQKEREIIEKTKAQILRMMGEESHNGSASPVYGIWKYAGGGSLVGKGVHPLGALLYLKRIEGIASGGKPIRPVAVNAKVHELTRQKSYRDLKLIRTDYLDIEDYGFIHVTFEDGMVGDIITSEVVLGGIYDYVEVFANNHRTRCYLSPAGLMETYNPRNEQYKDIYLIEKASTKEGWSPAAPDENFTLGYQNELQDFITSFQDGKSPQSDINLAVDTTLATYAAYVSDELGGREVEIPLL